jgi:hypothetical protein
MAEKMGSFTFLEIYMEIAMTLPKSKQLHFIEGLINYGLHGIDPQFTGVEQTAFISCRTMIDAGKKTSAARSENGKKGGQTSSKNKQSQANVSKNKQTQPKVKGKVNNKYLSLLDNLPVGESAAPKNGALSQQLHAVKPAETGIGLTEFMAKNPDVKVTGKIEQMLHKAFGSKT